MSALIGLQCHLCKTMFAAEATYVCDRCLGPLEPVYDYSGLKLTREQIAARPKNLWRYRELLPITGEPQTGLHSGFTPLVKCGRLAERLGVRTMTGGALPDAAVTAALVAGRTRHFLVYPNYDALLQYNCAHSYALSVALLGDRLASAAAPAPPARSRPPAHH